MNNEFLEVSGEKYFALFVNSETPPVNYEPLDNYVYVELSDDIQFLRLFRVYYEQSKDGFSIRHSLLTWLPVPVKPHCKQALKNHIDTQKAFSEFLIPN